MKHIIFDKTQKFITIFNAKTGMYLRTGILDKDGKDTGIDPFMASYPHLIDVGVMGHCTHGKKGLCVKAGVGCYQNGLHLDEPNMDLKSFKKIASEASGKVHQFALGGRGDPDQHEDFEELLRISRSNKIVPNFTTSGYGLTQEKSNMCREYCGAVAVSWYRSSYTLRAVQMLIRAGVKTNIHYVLGNNTIDEAIDKLKTDDFPEGINAVIFLLHKPVGLGKHENVLQHCDPRVQNFFSLLDTKHSYKVGIDSCMVPGAVQFSKNVLYESVDTCEGGRFSCYIGPDLTMLPCSFDQAKRYGVSLRNHTILEAWNSEKFCEFRTHLKNACPNCNLRELCFGGCPLKSSIVLCLDKH